ncbi:MAG: 3-deoxy-8-phosphooctulonate synthase [Candidatus Aminicenantes bacterium]|nr:3-deoxy-8-phosphooctulonate synthase [Candidatus Aminicenantes bacterium]
MPTDVKDICINERIRIGGTNPLFLIGGPCVLENRDHALSMARKINAICRDLNIPFIFKASYDKANRSSLKSFRGPGLKEGLQILSEIKQELSIPVLSDVHETSQIQRAADILDIIQIPAFLCRQTDLIVAAARTQKPLNIKKGQFISPYEVKNIVEKITDQGNESIILTERGTSFGYGNLIFDVRSIPIMKELGFPVVIDASHSVQLPGGEGHSSGGEAKFIPSIARAGISVGCDGIFCEIHDNPEKALSDKHNSLRLNELRSFLKGLLKLRRAVDEINSLE